MATTYYFVTFEGTTVSKHRTFEVAEKKRIALGKYDGKPITMYDTWNLHPKTNRKIVTVEKDTPEYEKHMEQLAFNKEEREKYNMAYQRENPEGYKEFLEKRNEWYKRKNEERFKSL